MTTPRPIASNETRVSPSRAFTPGLKSKLDIMQETVEVVRGPGDALNLMSGKKFREVRSELDASVPFQGLHAADGQTPRAVDVPNPDTPDGKWDPYQFMPRFVFDAAEDAFPVDPIFDGDLDYNNNGPETAGAPGRYKDGVIGGDQGLNGAFTVTKKGEYTILTYSFYYAHNKAGDYHKNDYSTAQVYLKPGPDGKLAPAYLSGSWHHGSILTPWEDLAKDKDGRPALLVQLGSHALQAVGKGQSIPKDGLQIGADGQSSLNGKPLGHRLALDAFQTNVHDARYLNPVAPTSGPRISMMRWGEAAMNPFLPELYEKAPSPLSQVLTRYGREIKGFVAKGWDKLKGLFS